MAPLPSLPRWPNFVVLLGVAWALTAALLLADRWPELAERLFDADDAMRLVQLREFLAGNGWFNLHEARLDPPAGYDTHWSRLIDAGLAGLYLAFRPFAAPELAERLMRAVWPLLWLLIAMASVAALAWRLAGRKAALVVLLLSACALPAFQHFKPGRIDHHNVQIALALAVTAAAAWSDRARHAATLAGALTGLAVAVGLESILFIALSGAAMALHGALNPAAKRPAGRYGLAVAASTFAGYLLTVGVDGWFRPACDALAINWVAPAMVAGLGLWVASRIEADRRGRVLMIAVIGAAALFVFVAIEPRCLRGPFALTDPAVRVLWLDRVDETEPLVSVLRGFPVMGAFLCAFPLLALVAALALARDGATRRDFGFLLAAVALLLALAETFAAVKVYAYAMWFGMPVMAALACRLTMATGPRAQAARLAGALILTPTAITAGAITLAQAAAGTDPAYPGVAERSLCTSNQAFAAMAGLPPGLVVTDINYGPYVLALTPHRVLAAPYHRTSGGILATDAILNAPPPEASRLATLYSVDYVAICGQTPPTGATLPAGSLRAKLSAGRAPAWLTPLPGAAPFAVFRVQR